MKQLYPKQIEHAGILTRALQTYNAALDASATGTGKTLVAADIAAALKRPVFVVALKSGLPMWREELAERGVKPLAVINYELLRRGKQKWGGWIGRNLWQWKLPENTLIIHDECQRYQGFGSLNSRMLIAAKPFMNLALSATAAEDPVDMRALGYVLGLHNLRDFWRWCKERGCSPNQWGGLDFNGDEKVLAKLHTQIFPDHGHRLTITDLAEHFQETQIITTPVEFGNKLKSIYEAMESELDELADIMTTDSTHPAAEALVAQLRARQQVELLKVPTMIEMTEDLLAEGRSVVLFVNFQATIDTLNARFKEPHCIISGKHGDRPAVQAAFQANNIRLLICNVQAGGVSLNLHDVHGGHPRTAIISPSWSAKDIIQTLGRVHRAGGATPSQQHVLFAAGTVEEKVEKVVRTKIRQIGIFNGDVQISVDKKLQV